MELVARHQVPSGYITNNSIGGCDKLFYNLSCNLYLTLLLIEEIMHHLYLLENRWIATPLHWFIMAQQKLSHLLGVAIAIYFHYGDCDCDCDWAYTVGKCAPGQAPKIKNPATDWTETIIRWSQITIRDEGLSHYLLGFRHRRLSSIKQVVIARQQNTYSPK